MAAQKYRKLFFIVVDVVVENLVGSFILSSGLSYVLHLTHDAQPVAAPYLLYVLFRELVYEELACEIEHVAAVGKARYAAVAIEVGAQTHMVYAHHLYGMAQVLHEILNCCLACF